MNTSQNVKNMTLAALFTALTAISAFIRIPFPYVPITLQTFFVVLSGAVLGSKWGSISQIAYIVIGLTGVPIFTAGGGPGYVLQPTFGYLLGGILSSFLTGYIIEKSMQKTAKVYVIACTVGIFSLYLIGVPYLAVIYRTVLGKTEVVKLAITSGFLLFIPGDLVKLVLASILSIRLRPIIMKRRE